MSCTSCGGTPSSRYGNQQSEEEARERRHTASPDTSTAEYMNTLSFGTLLSMRQDAYNNEMAAFFEAASKMSEDMKALQVHILVEVIDGREYSPNGQTPLYCARLLKQVVGHKTFAGVVESRFSDLPAKLDRYLAATPTLG